MNVIIILLAALTMRPKDMEFVITAWTIPLGISVNFASHHSIEILKCHGIILTLVLVSTYVVNVSAAG